MNIKPGLMACLLTLATGLSGPALADDVDVFNGNPDVTSQQPNVLIVLDNTANWNIPFSWEKETLATIVNSLNSNFNVGLMMFSETGGGNSSTDGGYVRYAIRNMDGTNRPVLVQMVNDFDQLADKSNGGKLGLTMYEAYAYYAGGAAYAGNNKVKADYGTGCAVANNPACALAGHALDSFSAASYHSPLNPDQPCANNYIIFISNGPSQDNASDTTAATTKLSAAGGSTTMISPPDTNSTNNIADEWTRFMYGTDLSNSMADVQNIITYTVEVQPGTTGQGPYNTRLLKSMANQGHGRYFDAVDTGELTYALQTIFNEINAKNSVFASVSLPISVNTQGVYLNQVYMGMFRPDRDGLPRWMGNLKQYRFAYEPATGALFLTDSRNITPQPNIANASTGFISPDAVSYWTTAGAAPGFWSFSPSGDPASAYDSPDGAIVEKGGAAQRQRIAYATSQASRNLYTCTGTCLDGITTLSSANTHTLFATTNTDITDASVGISSPIAISSITRSDTTATATTASNHGFTAGLSVTIAGTSQTAYNGLKVIGSIPAANQFTFTVTTTPASPDPGASITAYVPAAAKTVSALSNGTAGAGTSLTATATANNHGFTTGQSVSIAGATPATFNGAVTITVTDANHFTYSLPSLSVTSLSNGSGSGASNPATKATAVTSAAHGFSIGTPITIAGVTNYSNFNGNFTVTGVPTPTSFTYTIVSPGNNKTAAGTITARLQDSTSATGTITASGVSSALAVTSLTRSNTTATATTASSHGYSTGDTVTIAGATGTEYNGNFTITSTTANTFTYTVTTGPPDVGAGGTVQAGSTTTRTSLINWVRGQDNMDDENNDGSLTDVRASIHGDVLHSRPAVVNYGGSTGVVVYYGGNDGILRAIEGGQTSSDGDELWGFIPEEFLADFIRLRDNSPGINFPSVPGDPKNKPYFSDGPITVYTLDANNNGQLGDAGDKVYLYLGMRRGGRFIYALDVTNPTAPKFMWRKSSADLAELGQTWSQMSVATVHANTNPVLIFGAGYDPDAEDVEPAVNAGMGRGVYVLDAYTGDLVKFFSQSDDPTPVTFTRSFPADVAVIDRDGDGYADRLYAVDTGANIWRMDIDDANETNWKAYHLASLGGTGSNARKFLYAPDVVIVFAGDYDSLLLGSGDREHPLLSASAYDVANRFYMIRDYATGKDGSGQALITESDLVDLTSGGTMPVNTKGWYIRLAGGEQVVGSAVTATGITFFDTNQPTEPDAQSCTGSLGIARRYAVSFSDASATLYGSSQFVEITGGGLAPSPIVGMVFIDQDGDGAIDPGETHLFETDNPAAAGHCPAGSVGCTEGSPVQPLTAEPVPTRHRTYWFQEIDSQ